MRCAKGLTGLIVGGLCLAACASEAPASSDDTPELNTFDLEAAFLASCEDVVDQAPTAEGDEPRLIALPVPLNPEDLSRTDLDRLTYVAGFQLRLEEGDWLGGLSGLEFVTDKNLLAVSDAGTLFEFSLTETSEGKLGVSSDFRSHGLYDARGKRLKGKRAADAEGLDWKDGRLLVSFERDHRVLTYDVASCGFSARGIPIATFDGQVDGRSRPIDSNRGMEGLVSFGDSLVVALESAGKDMVQSARFTPGADRLAFQETLLPASGLKLLVGLDGYIDAEGRQRIYSLRRSYDPIRGNRIALYETIVGVDSFFIAELAGPMTVDNFEGISVLPLADDLVRIAIVSDNNFSDRQRTLLMFFDHTPSLPEDS